MVNREIQEQRMRGYFIQATKEILKGEGFKAISVRNIAERAGYSYATLYNYFKDVRELIFECVIDFQQECRVFVADQVGILPPGPDRIKASMLGYVKFFLEYPGVFDLFFLEKANGIEGKRATCQKIYDFPADLCADDWAFCLKENVYSAAQIERKKAQTVYVSAGLMLFFLNRRIPADYILFINTLERQLEAVLYHGW